MAKTKEVLQNRASWDTIEELEKEPDNMAMQVYSELYSPKQVEAILNNYPSIFEALQEITEMANRWSIKGLTPTIHKAETILKTCKIINNGKD